MASASRQDTCGGMRVRVWDLLRRYALALPVPRLRVEVTAGVLLSLGLRLVVVVVAPGDPSVKARWC